MSEISMQFSPGSRHFVTLLFLLLLPMIRVAAGQDVEVDSLTKLLQSNISDTTRMEVLDQLGFRLAPNDSKSAHSYFEDLFQLASTQQSEAYLIRAYTGFGACNYYSGEWHAAIENYRNSLRISVSLDDSLNIAKANNNLGLVYTQIGQLDSAIFAYEAALDHYPALERQKYEASLHINIGLVFQKKGNHQQANEYFLKSLAWSEASNDQVGINNACFNIGNIHYYLKDYHQAISYYRRSIQSQGYINVHTLANAYSNLGSCFLKVQEVDSSIHYHERALSLRRDMGNEGGVSSSLYNLGNSYYEMGQYHRAKELHWQAVEICETRGNKSNELIMRTGLARDFLELNDLQKAEKQLNRALLIATDVAEPRSQLPLYRNFIRLYRKNRSLKAFDYFDKYVALNDSLRDVEQIREVAQLQAQFDFDKEKEILTIENKVREELLLVKMAKERVVRNTLMGGLIVGLLALGFVWRSRQQKLKTNIQLERQKKIIAEALKERENLLKEIHHRVKNNLQVISSLLSIQSQTIDDKVALAAISEGQNRVQAMALIHQNLYEDGNLVGVDLPNYIQNLSTNLLHAYQTDDKKIGISQRVTATNLDIDTIIPLGLILNELISNSLKYAFSGRTDGEIRIEIDEEEEGVRVAIADDGIGLPKDFEVDQADSMGFRLVRSFVDKMQAQWEIISKQGTRINIFVPFQVSH